ncbi:uncharacterized protein [Apostichopus japonicus]|uniref:uncharacterized protein isoform X2 n=1 Tax=Stichopus japonicus TaxID=307972 RepID=UPI003AB3103B
MALSRLLTVILGLCSLGFVDGSHFRGGVITWRPISNLPVAPGTFPTLIFNYRVAFRSSFSADHACDNNTVASGAINPGEGSLRCDNGCTALNDNFDYRCTDFSVEADWTTGLGESTFNPDTNTFEVFYEGRNWISLANGGNGRWVIRSRVDLRPRPDNGRINSSPTTSNMPIVRIQLNCPTIFVIPVTDPDGDTVRCRYAVDTNDECGSICGNLSILNEDTCILTWTPTEIGLFGAAFQIEDFINPSSTTPLSSIPLQFLFEVFLGDGSCAEAPTFDPVVLPGESCIAVPTGSTFTTRIEAVVSNPTRSIVAINTVSPLGVTTSSVQQVPGSDLAYFIDVTFTSTDALQMQQIFCFVAEDNGGLTSEQRCIFLVTATQPPVPVSLTVDSNNVLTIEVDTQVTTPGSQKLISIMSATTGQEVFSVDTSIDATVSADGNAILVQLPAALPSDTFRANLRRGVFESNDFCGVENEPVIAPIVVGTPMVGGDCPMNINVILTNNENVGFVSWTVPSPPVGSRQLAGPVVTQGFYPAGTNNTIRYIYQNATSDYEFCEFNVTVGPNPHPCPENMVVRSLRGTGGAIVTWAEPVSRDRIISAPVPSGSFLTPGITCVSYAFNSTLGFVDSCTFDVEVVEVSPCDDEPCDNDGICIATGVDAFQCICETQCYIGPACEIDIHACVSDPCMNGGTCELVGGSCSVYYCECPPCYTGPTCETAIDPCANSLCKNGSECVPKEGSCESYTCECEDCVFGAFCEFEVPNPCQFDPCENGFTCAMNSDNCYGYICLSDKPDPSCASGGIEIPVTDKCLSSPCKNFGVCIPTKSWGEEGGFTCICAEGYGGYLCDEEIEDNPDIQSCSNTTCLNNATCFNSYTSFHGEDVQCEHTCVCEDGYWGPDCAKPAGKYNPCATYDEPCLNGGICRDIFISPRNDQNLVCDCAAGYGGHRCEIEMDDRCASQPCMNDGTCTRFGTFFKCTCASGFYGLTCEDQFVDETPPLVLNCPTPIIVTSDVPVAVPWFMPTVLDFDSSVPVRMVSANASPGAVYNPGHFQSVELVFADIDGNEATCEFWIYVEPITLPF